MTHGLQRLAVVNILATDFSDSPTCAKNISEDVSLILIHAPVTAYLAFDQLWYTDSQKVRGTFIGNCLCQESFSSARRAI